MLIYKNNLNQYITKYNIIYQVNNIQYKIDSKTISNSDQSYISAVDQLITTGMLLSEKKRNPPLVVANLSVMMLKLYTYHQ